MTRRGRGDGSSPPERPNPGPRAPVRPPPELPDVRDGLTRRERVVLWVLSETQRERGGRSVPTAQLYGRVCEYEDMSVEELQSILIRLGARGGR